MVRCAVKGRAARHRSPAKRAGDNLHNRGEGAGWRLVASLMRFECRKRHLKSGVCLTDAQAPANRLARTTEADAPAGKRDNVRALFHRSSSSKMRAIFAIHMCFHLLPSSGNSEIECFRRSVGSKTAANKARPEQGALQRRHANGRCGPATRHPGKPLRARGPIPCLRPAWYPLAQCARTQRDTAALRCHTR